MMSVGFSRARHWLALAAALLVALAIAGVAYAYEVGPMRITLVPAEGRTSGNFRINNTRDEALPVELHAFRRIVARDGTQQLVPADDDFVIFPLQANVAARASQAVRFQYVGPRDFDVSQAYVVQVREVPVVPPGFSGVRFTYDFGVAVYLDPPRAEERLTIDAVERTPTGLRLTISNSGNRYATITTQRLDFSVGGTARTLSPGELRDRIASPLVPPRSVRDLDVLIDDLGEGEISNVALVRDRG